MGRITQLKDLSPQEWKVMIASLFLLPWVALLLRFKGLSASQQMLIPQAEPSTAPPGPEQLESARRISRMVDVAANHGLYRASCLKRSLVVAWFLRRQGIPFELRIGTARDKKKNGEEHIFSAHAWIESGGEVLNDHANVRDSFSPFEF